MSVPADRDSAPVIAVVPARVGSSSLPRKDMRMLGGRPLIAYTVAAVEASGVASELRISTDDPAIRNWAEVNGHQVHDRDPQFADGAVDLGELAATIADQLDAQGIVAVFPPSSPFRSADTIAEAVRRFREADARSLSSCVRVERVHWHAASGSASEALELPGPSVTPLGSEAGLFQDNGAMYLVEADSLRASRRLITDDHVLMEMSAADSLRVDRITDLVDARRRVSRGTVVFRLRADTTIGSGHLFHSLQLADELADQDIAFLLKECDPWVETLIERNNFPIATEHDLAHDLTRLAPEGARVLVNDVLDTTEHDVLLARGLGFKVVNVEDLGSGARYADWVVNALYRPVSPAVNIAWGPRYATLREEFHNLPVKEIREQATDVLITFGGTDPAGLALRCARLLHRLEGVRLHVVLGPGAAEASFPDGVRVSRTIPSMAKAMFEADLILTAAGRTVYEAARVGTPVVVLAANAREATHAHIGYESGVVFLGIGPLVTDEHIVDITSRTLQDQALRRELSHRLQASIDDGGTRRIGAQIRNLLYEP